MPLDPVALMDAKPADANVQLWHSHPAVASPVKPSGRPRAISEPLVRGLGTAPDTPPAERGVTLQALLKLGAGVPRHLTTAEAVRRYVVPATASRATAYFALLPHGQVAPPAYLVVHSWAAPFHHLLDQLRARFLPPRGPAANPFLWLDFIALPYHDPPAAPRPPGELHAHLAAVAALTATATTLVSLGPHAEALADLPCLHALATLAAKHHRHAHLQFLTALPPALPFLVEAFAAIDITAAHAASALDRRATLDAVATLAGPAPRGGPPLPARAADPAAGAAAALNPLLQRTLVERAAQWAALQAEAAATPADAADCHFLQAAMQLAGPRVGPRDSLLESAEHLAGRCLALRSGAVAAAGAPGRPAAVVATAAARHLLAEVIRQREAAAAAVPGGAACERRLGTALQLLEEAVRELLAAGGPVQQAARALVAAAEACNSLARYQQAHDLAARALGLLAATSAATTTGVQPADRAAANAALGHSLLQQGDPDAAEAPLHAAAEHHAAAAPLLNTPAPYCRRAAPVLHDYSAVLLRLGRVAEATHWARRALAAAEAAHGPEEPATADCMEALAAALLEHSCPSSGPPSSSSSTSSYATTPGAPDAPAGCAPLLHDPPSPGAQPCCSPCSPPAFLAHRAFHPSSPFFSAAGHPAAALQPPSSGSLQLCGSASSTTSTCSAASAATAASLASSCGTPPAPAAAADPRCSEAEELLRRRLRVMLQHHGAGHPVVVRCSHTLAQALHRTRQHAEAERIYLAVLQCLREALPPPLPAPPPQATPYVEHPAAEPASEEPEPMAVEPMAAESPLAAESSWGGCVEVVADPMLLCGEAELAGMKTLLGGARSSSSTLDDALWRADNDTCCAAAAAAAGGPLGAGGGLAEGCPARPRLADVLQELAAVYDDWGRLADANLCRRQAAALMPQQHELEAL